MPVLPLEQIGQLLRFFLAGTLFTAVSGDEPSAVGEPDDAQGTVRRAALAGSSPCRVGEVFQILCAAQGGGAVGALLCIESCAECAHQTGDRRPDNVVADLPLKAPQHGVVQECAALYHDVLSQFLGIAGTDDLVDGVLDDRAGQTGGDILDGCAVLLRLLDAAVHENGAAGAKVYRMLGEQPQSGEVGDVVAQRHGERLNKRAAAGGTCLVQHDAVNAVVFDLEALDVLAADVDDEVHLRTEERCRLEVRHGFHNAEVHAQSGTDEILAVAGDGTAADGAVRTQPLIEGGQLPFDAVQRLSLVGGVEIIEQLVVFREQHDLGGGRAGINAQIRLAGIGAVVAPCHIVGGVALLKPLVFLRIAEQGLVCHQRCLRLCLRQHLLQLRQSVGIRQGAGGQGAAVGDKGSAVLRKMGVFLVQL